jgi:hypothetical protein
VSFTVVLVPDLYLDFSEKSGLAEVVGSGWIESASGVSFLSSAFASDFISAVKSDFCVGGFSAAGSMALEDSSSDVTLIFFLTHLADGSID